MPPKPKTVQALTLRVPIADYNLLRAEAFVRDWSINEVVLDAIRGVIEGEHREVLEEVLARARSGWLGTRTWSSPTAVQASPERLSGSPQDVRLKLAPIGVRLTAFSGAR
jgi:hypothetical protein